MKQHLLKYTCLLLIVSTAQLTASTKSAGPPSAAGQLALDALWDNATDNGDGWYYLDWFGWFTNPQAGWILHAEHGYLYCSGDSTSSVYAYDPRLGEWFWISAASYPNMYKFGTAEGWYWYYSGGQAGARWFYQAESSVNIHESAFTGYAEPSIEIPDLRAYFKFNGNYADETDNDSEFEYDNTPIVDNSLYCNGVYAYEDQDTFRASVRVAELDVSSFTLSADFKPESIHPNGMPTLAVSGGYRWLIVQAMGNGTLRLSFNNNSKLFYFDGPPIQTDIWQRITVTVDMQQRTSRLFLNGSLYGEAILPEDFEINRSGPIDHAVMFIDFSRGSVFHGFVDNLMIIDTALSVAEVQQALAP